MILKPGDRIRMINMPQDPNPIPAGSLGTVTTYRWGEAGGRVTYGVDWDDRMRGLNIIIPIDTVEIVT